MLMMLIFPITGPVKLYAQTYQSKNNSITFFSEAPLENIQATSNKVIARIDTKTGVVKSVAIINTFEFEKSLMKKHFNEQYMESDKFPLAIFTGKITDIKRLQSQQNGEYKMSGEITIHGVTQKLNELMVILSWKDQELFGKANFKIRTADHDIKIPKLVIQNIAEIVDVKVVFNLEKLN